MSFNRLDAKIQKLLTKTQLAEQMCVQPRTIDNWMKVGLVPHLKIGKTVRFEFSSVMEKLKSYELGGER